MIMMEKKINIYEIVKKIPFKTVQF